jgi:hypothetical protein
MNGTMETNMKKYLIMAIIGVALILPRVSAAQTAMGRCPGGTDPECPASQVCDPDTKQCIPDTNDGLEGIGGSCSTDDDCRGASAECSPTTQKCVYDTTSDSAPASVQNSTTAVPPTTGASSGNNFVPLTSLPGLSTVAGLSATSGLPAFFNQLYKICIGVCAAIAFFQIIRAGILYMSAGDNSGQVTKARGLITTSILGLVIVLSPYIVFSIINPSILSLNVNFASIAPSAVGGSSSITPAAGTVGAATTASASQCTATFLSIIAAGQSCPTGQTVQNAVCCSNPAGGQICCGK